MNKPKPAFRVYFNKRKQWFDVYIADDARKFMRDNKCWAYYQSTWSRTSRRGHFGSIHLSRVGAGLVAHELLHLLIDWISARGGKITDDNEERIVTMFGDMSQRFWIRYYAWKEHLSI